MKRVQLVQVLAVLVEAAACTSSGPSWTSITPGDLPADVPPSCTGTTFYEQTLVTEPLLCNGLPVWFGCEGNTYAEYTCSAPPGYLVEGTYPDPGDPSDTIIATPPDGSVTDGNAG